MPALFSRSLVVKQPQSPRVKGPALLSNHMTVPDRIVLEISGLVGRMMYPVSVLPGPLRFLARLIPVTYSLEGMRAALLGGAAWRELWPSIAALLIFAAILIPLSFLIFGWALRRTKITG